MDAEKSAIAAHLSLPPQIPGRRWQVSGLMAVLRDARQATGRDLATGDVEDPDQTGSFLGALGYMIFLEHVGYCFRPTGEPKLNATELEKGLLYFTTSSADDAAAVYALRCAVAHAYNLWNVGTSKDPTRWQQLTHHFRLVAEDGDQVVAPGKELWSGDTHTRTHFNWTTVNLRAFGDLADGVRERLVSLMQSDALDVALKGGVDELRLRYSFGTQVM